MQWTSRFFEVVIVASCNKYLSLPKKKGGKTVFRPKEKVLQQAVHQPVDIDAPGHIVHAHHGDIRQLFGCDCADRQGDRRCCPMHGQLDGASGCSLLSLLCRGVLERQMHLCVVLPLRTRAQLATWSYRAGCSYIAAMACLTMLRLMCLVPAEVAGCKRPCSLNAS